jgi:hypothetical protein
MVSFLNSVLLLTTLVSQAQCLLLQGPNAVQLGAGTNGNVGIRGMTLPNQWRVIGIQNRPAFMQHHVTAAANTLSATLGANQANGIVIGNSLSNTGPGQTRMWQMISDFAELNQIHQISHLIFHDVVEPSTCPALDAALNANAGEPDLAMQGSQAYNQIMGTSLGRMAAHFGHVQSIYITGGPLMSVHLEALRVTVQGGGTLVFNYVAVPQAQPAGQGNTGQGNTGQGNSGSGPAADGTHSGGCSCVIQRGLKAASGTKANSGTSGGPTGSTPGTSKDSCKCPGPKGTVSSPPSMGSVASKKTLGRRQRSFEA